MTNTHLNAISESQDIETQNGWREAQKKGVTEAEFLKAANYAGRDNARTPMQWSSGRQTDFTTGIPWMPVNPNHITIHVQAQLNDSESVLNYFRAMAKLRKENPVLTYGSFRPFDSGVDSLFLFFRESRQEKMLIVLNFSDQVANLPNQVIPVFSKRLIGNYPEGKSQQELQPWEARVYSC